MIRKFLALSRSTHGVLDLAMTGFAALLWLGGFPPWTVLVVAIVTAAAGYTAIYALNDLLGLKVDREKFANEINPGYSVEDSELRHPLAQGKLGLASSLAWFIGWYLIALAGAWWLNPYLVVLVVAAPIVEAIYCRLLKVTYWRALVSGLVKSLGPIAAVLVVVPNPAPARLALMVAWLVLWEIGGQNIPADWNDVEEDRRVGARTIPLVFGPHIAGILTLVSLVTCVALSLILPVMSPLQLGALYRVITLGIGTFILLVPAVQLYLERDSRHAAKLFDRASLYPLAQLLVIVIFVLLRRGQQ